MFDKQRIISDMWIKRAGNIHSTDDAFNLTALREGKRKHDAEVTFLQKTNLMYKDTNLLDLACGNGRLAESFSSAVNWVTATDLCNDFVEYLSKRNQNTNMEFFTLDLLVPDYSFYFQRSYSIILLFGVSQLILKDEDLLSIFKNIKKILLPSGHLLIKQTTSLENDDLQIDHHSKELNQRWIANYRTVEKIRKLGFLAGFDMLSYQSIYSEENLGEFYKKVEPWSNSQQIIFDMIHS